MASDRAGSVSGGRAGKTDHDCVYGHIDRGETKASKKLEIYDSADPSHRNYLRDDSENQQQYEYSSHSSGYGSLYDLCGASGTVEIYSVRGGSGGGGGSVSLLCKKPGSVGHGAGEELPSGPHPGMAFPYEYEQNTAYQSLQGLYAIGSGGLWGKGLGNSIQKLGKIPEPYNDYIFAIICEELGIFGAGLIILLFIYLLYRIYTVSQTAEDLLGRMLSIGVMSHIALQVILNLMVVTNLFPTTGVTLPFFSYGGTATVFLLIEIGLVLSVNKYSVKKRLEDERRRYS